MTTRTNWPTVAVEVAFNASPNSGTTPTWTALSTRALGFDVRRGRSYELTHVETGVASIHLRNDDGALDPTNGSSTYSPNVKVYRRVRIRATWASTTYDLFNGYVERWPLDWTKGWGTSPLTAVDGFAVLAARKFRPAYTEHVLAATPAPWQYYPLDETSGSSAHNASATVLPDAVLTPTDPILPATYAFGTDPSSTAPHAGIEHQWLGLHTAGSPSFDGYCLTLPQPISMAAAAGTGFMISLWFKITGDGNHVVGNLAIQRSAGAYVNYSIQLTVLAESVQFNVSSDTTGAAGPSITGTRAVDDGRVHHVLASYVNGVGGGSNQNKLAIYLDGVLEASTTTASGSALIGITDATSQLQIAGSRTRFSPPVGVDYLDGAVAEVAVYSTGLKIGGSPDLAAFAAAQYAMGASAVSGESADARESRLLALVPWRLGTALDASPTVMSGATGLDGMTALDAVLDVANDEGGVAYCRGDGALVFQSRRSRMLETTPSYTFGDGAGELPYDSCAFDYDPTYVYNDVTITPADGVGKTYVDATSQTDYFPRQLADDFNITSDAEAADAAAWIVNTHKDPYLRPTELVFTPSANPTTLFPVALAIEVGNRITVKRRPLGGHAVSVDCFVEGVEHEVTETANVWRTTLQLSPVSLQVLIADDAVFGLADSQYVAAW